MKKTLKFLSLTAALTALLAGMHLTVFAATPASSIAEAARGRTAANSVAQDAINAASGIDETSRLNNAANTASRIDTDEASRLNNVANPISESRIDEASGLNNAANTNPRTGAENLSIPAIVALLAASTAAITLTAKKRS